MKPGYKTSELWLTIIASALIGAGTVPVPEKWKWAPIALMVLGYAISRGLAKYETPATDFGPVFGTDLPDEHVDPVAAEEADQDRVVAEAKPKRARKARTS